MSVVLSMTFVAMFLLLVGIGFMAVSIKRSAFLWSLLATVIFSVNIVYSGTIPFQTDSTGAVIGNAANVVLSGVNLLFCLVSLAFTIYYGIWAFRGTRDEYI